MKQCINCGKNRVRIGIATLLLIVVSFGLVACTLGANMTTPTHDAYKKEALNSFIEVQVGKFERQDVFGDKSTYPDFWYGVNTAKLNSSSNGKNIESAKAQIIETEAICYYAEQNDIVVTNDEVQERIENIISEGKKADNYKEIETACEAVGISFEDTVKKDIKINWYARGCK